MFLRRVKTALTLIAAGKAVARLKRAARTIAGDDFIFVNTVV